MLAFFSKKNLETGAVIIAAMAVGKVTLYAIDKGANAFTTWYNKPKTEKKTETTTVKSVS